MIAQASPAAGPLQTDPSKRVNYTLGLVLGVDEFQQDQLYHAAGRRGHNRLLHGYGTVWGLAVGIDAGSDPEVQVDPGVAVDPAGREIRVADRMCVKLNRWLDRHRPTLEQLYPDPTAQPLPLAVVLCYRECSTDTVPVPGEPCRSQDDAMQPSRIRESFELKLMLRDDAPWASPPASDATDLGIFRLFQPEEQAVRAFGVLLARVQTTTDPELSADGEQALLDGVRALVHAADEGTLASPPPADDDPILLPAATAPEILRNAFRVWVTEVRPAIRALEDPGTCGGDACCVLLAELDLPVGGDWAAHAGEVGPLEERRPYLLHTRLLQEWLIAGGGEEGRPDVDSWATLQILGPDRIRFWVHHDGWLNVPAEALTVLVNDAEVEISTLPWSGVRNVWDIVLVQEMSDGDAVEVRFDTRQVELIQPPYPEMEGVEAKREAEGASRAESPKGAPAIRPRPRDPVDDMPDWTPADGEPLDPPQSVADELNGPSGEYLDRYGWSLSAFTVYDRLEGGDLEGEYKLPIVAKIQTTPVDPTRPRDPEQYLRFDGARWTPAFLDDGKIDLRGRYPNSTVVGIQGHPISSTDPRTEQYLVWDGDAWVPRFLPDGRQDLSGRYPDSTVVGIQKTPVSSAAPRQEQYLKFDVVTRQWVPSDLPDARGDLKGRYPDLSIAALQGHTVSAGSPGAGQALAFVGGQWVPADAVGLLPGAGGDLSGSYPAPSVTGLRGRRIATTAPQEGQVLVFRESSPPGSGQWVPGLSSPTGPATGDLNGSYPGPNVAGLRGRPISGAAPLDGQVLVFRESSPPGNGQWVPQAQAGGGGGGPPTGAAGGDLAGSYPNPVVARLRGRTVSANAPQQGQVLVYQESSPPGNGTWVPQAQSGGGGGGATGPAGGDLGGTYPNPRILALQGVKVVADKPATGQFLMFDGDQWVPADAGPASGAYEVVAAGVFLVRAMDGLANPLAGSFGGLFLEGVNDAMWRLHFPSFDPKTFTYVVKGMATRSDVQLADDDGDLSVFLPGISKSELPSTLHLEVSAYRFRENPIERNGVPGLARATAGTEGSPTVAPDAGGASVEGAPAAADASLQTIVAAEAPELAVDPAAEETAAPEKAAATRKSTSKRSKG